MVVKILCSLGSKGGTGKSSIIFAVCLMLIRNTFNNVMIINADNSSSTIPSLIGFAGIENKITMLNIDSYYLPLFYRYNIEFFEKFNYVLIDLKGEEISDQDFLALGSIVDKFIVPIIPSMAGMPAATSLVDKAIAFDLCQKIVILFNLLGLNERSETLAKMKLMFGDYVKKSGIKLLEDCVVNVSNIDDKGADKGLLSTKKNCDIMQEIIDLLD